MTRGQSEDATPSSTADWPNFELTYTYNPDADCAVSLDLRPDELVVFEGTDEPRGESWLTAERGSYVQIEETR
jgi:hypothetical protein